MSSYTFKMDEKTEQNCIAWCAEHVQKCPDPPAVTWGRWDYIFTPTGVEDGVRIRCCICKEEKDITYRPSLDEVFANLKKQKEGGK